MFQIHMFNFTHVKSCGIFVRGGTDERNEADMGINRGADMGIKCGYLRYTF